MLCFRSGIHGCVWIARVSVRGRSGFGARVAAARVAAVGPLLAVYGGGGTERGTGVGKSLIATASFSIIFIKVSDTRSHVATRLAAIARSTYVDIRPVAQVGSSTSPS